MKPREKAKEEAMKLLKSGAISIENKNERHTFKRKPKESEEDEVPGPNMNLKVKQSLYRNFLPGPILNALGPEEKKVDVLSNHKAATCEVNCTDASETLQTKRKQQFNLLLDDKNLDTDQIHAVSISYILRTDQRTLPYMLDIIISLNLLFMMFSSIMVPL
ncbi:hypothetical protein MS3_00009906 [Schistosoma haematobium]|uniref:Uncharacterized protein n=1 Tax=Schistosoma haematobium TaxID=6185 RepID=A0A922S603_SCHHA|nr:hypothetical protein MS3_00009906 [Schistosoma haematobium]KAH9595187.1 hypothetical protein MS3_00009906 [Schistosoma haematobium]